MNLATSSRPRQLYAGWTLLLPLIAMSVYLYAPPERRMVTALIAAPVFAFMQFVLPKCRPRLEHYLCPVNIALFLLFLKLIVVPCLIMGVGAESKILTTLPSFRSMEGALQIDILAYVAFCAGLTLAPERIIRPSSAVLTSALSQSPSGRLVLIFACLGMIGFAAAFGSPARIVQYFLEPSAVVDIQQELDGTLFGLFGTILRPFLAFSLVAWWSRISDRMGENGSIWPPTLVGLIAALGITIANLTFSFNRAAFVFPLICLAATYSARIRLIPIGFTIIVAVGALPALMAISTYRSNLMAGAEGNSGNATFAESIREASETIQAYSGGPQFSALFYDRLGWGNTLYGGSTLIASALSPVPVLGKRFRDNNGPALFNRAIYGGAGFEDQIIPFDAELFANFHAPGVLFGFVLLGLLLSYTQLLFAAAQSTFAAFSIQYASLWAAMLAAWSLSIFSQILIYFFVPIYFYLAVLQLRKWILGFDRGARAMGVAR